MLIAKVHESNEKAGVVFFEAFAYGIGLADKLDAQLCDSKAISSSLESSHFGILIYRSK